MNFDQVFLTKLIFDQTPFLLARTVRWPKGPTVAHKTRRLGKKGIKVVVGLDDLARLLRNDATGCFCLFGGQSHRHGKIFLFVVVLDFSSLLATVFLLLSWLSSLLLVHQLSMACALLHRRHSRSLRPLFLSRRRSLHCAHVFFDVVAQQSSPSRRFPRSSVATQLLFFYCCVRVPLVRVSVHRGHDRDRRDHRHRRCCIVEDTINYRHVARNPGACVLCSPTCAPCTPCGGCSRIVFLRDCANDRTRRVRACHQFFLRKKGLKIVRETFDCLVAINPRVFHLRRSPRRDLLHCAIRGAIAMSLRWLGCR
jgi:hypothetical protein